MRISKKETLDLVRSVLKGERCTNADISIITVNDATMKKLNGTYLNHRYTTDVLSFNLSESRNGILEGEVYINLDQANRQAKDYGVTFKNETRRLIIHGVLHLLGYSDATMKQKKHMTVREDHYLQFVS
jgi:rRNA maturation RNase YbeY